MLAALVGAGWLSLAAPGSGKTDNACLAPNGGAVAQCQERLARDVTKEPYDVSSLAELASLKAASGDVARARALFAQVDHTTRRHGQTQYWLFMDALVRGDVDTGLLHADVLFRTQRALPLPVTLPLIGSLDRSDTRVALASYLSASPRPWSDRLIREIAYSARSPDVESLLLDLQRASRGGVNASHAPLLDRLMREARYGAIKAYLSDGPGRAAELVRDPDFDQEAEAWLLGWTTRDQAAGGAQRQDQFGGRTGVLVLRHDLFSSGQPLVQQALFAEPGPLQISVVSQATTTAAYTGAFQVVLRCQGGPVIGRQVLFGAPGEWTQTTATLVVPPDCPAQNLLVEAVLGDVRSDAEIGLDRLSVRPGGPSKPPAAAS